MSQEGSEDGSNIDERHESNSNSISNSALNGSSRKNGNKINSKTIKRIISVEQKMQRTAAQKLTAERLVLGRGIFDMGSSMKDGDGDGMTVAGKSGT